jgi:hypothetical protein
MSFGPTIAEIKSRISIADAAQRLGYAGEIGKLCRSPFPNEHKHADRNKSFSVYPDPRGSGQRWKNHATDEGGDVIDFVQKFTATDQPAAIDLCRQWLGFSKQGISEHPNRRTPTQRRPKKWQCGTTQKPNVAPPSEPAPHFEAKPMPERERELWDAGRAHLGMDTDFAVEIDVWRGWTPGTTSRLVEQGLVSAPMLRDRRAVAFPVQAPRKGGWEAIGFHARHNPADDCAGKAWSFHPKGIPALPFVMGPFGAARLIIVLEGQWDCIAFADAAGWLDTPAAWPEEIAITGIRGATSWRTFLTHWLPHWPTAPKILLIPDADDAGQRWKGDFAEQLREHAVSVHILSPRAGEGKDFSDLHKTRPFTPADIARMLQGLRLVSAQGALTP